MLRINSIVQRLKQFAGQKQDPEIDYFPYEISSQVSDDATEVILSVETAYPSPTLTREDAALEADIERWRRQCRPLACNLDMMAGLVYVDSRGNSSKRRVEIHSILSSEDGFRYIKGLCLLRNSWRNFREDRIQELVDLETGEIFEPPTAFFDKYSLFEGSELEKLQIFLHILSYLARADRRFVDEEKQVIVGVIGDFYEGPKLSLIEAYAFNHRVKKQGFLDDVERLRYMDQDDILYFLEKAKLLIEADGKVTAKETELFEVLR
ncbi:MAG: WYL domain-containing protein [Deltaproteobacteria bacterium]|nr:WYL domain-containing protein [Deltaproteobacteria bacterium]MBW2025706.1 WYL domain-containing protein [Deltaproteobacteria bacterium]MBW2124247.1 WYL domain-containing protein [Deltaproteobacteria bacterium]